MTEPRKENTVSVTSILVHVCESCRKGEGGKCESNLCEHWGCRKATDEMLRRALAALHKTDSPDNRNALRGALEAPDA